MLSEEWELFENAKSEIRVEQMQQSLFFYAFYLIVKTVKPVFSKSSHSSLNTYYETEIPSLTRISLHVVLLTNLVNTNFA